MPIHQNKNSIPCWSRDRLKQYLTGWSDETAMQELEFHLSHCQSCEKSLADLETIRDTEFDRCHHDSSLTSDVDPIVAQALASVKASPKSSDFSEKRSGHSPSMLDQSFLVSSFHLRELGPYELMKPLGRGGMGMVYLAKHRRLNRIVAVKILPNAFVTADAQARFEREIQAAGKLNHPAIVLATDAGQVDGIQYLAMEYIDGLDLGRIARAVQTISINDVCEIGRQIAVGLAVAHRSGMVHRDIKPSNVMLDVNGDVKILDFGLVLLDRWDGLTSELTTVGQFLGTLDYMAPEQAERCSAVDYRADLYSLGATIFRLLCGRAPLAAAPNQSPLEKLRLLANHRPPSLKTVRPDAPPALVQLVDQLLKTDPTDRPPSADHVAEQLMEMSNEAALPKLLNQAKQANLDLPESSSSPRMLPVSMARRNGQQSNGVRPPFRSGWLAAAALPFLFAAGYWIVLQTTQGQLVIDSDVADIQVKLLRDGALTKEITVETGTTSTRLQADRYELVLQSPSDSLSIDNQQFTVKRGETIIARIRRQSSSDPIESDRDKIGAGDTLAIHLEGIIPFVPPSQPPLPVNVIQAGDHHPVLGFPFPVAADGTINLPLVGPVSVAGRTIESVREEIRRVCLERGILKERDKLVVAPGVAILLKANERLPVRNINIAEPIVRTTIPSQNESLYKGKRYSEWLVLLFNERSFFAWLEAFNAIDAQANSKDKRSLSSEVFVLAMRNANQLDSRFFETFAQWTSPRELVQKIIARAVEAEPKELEKLCLAVQESLKILDVPQEIGDPLWKRLQSFTRENAPSLTKLDQALELMFANLSRVDFNTALESIRDRPFYVIEKFPDVGRKYMLYGFFHWIQSQGDRLLTPSSERNEWVESKLRSLMPNALALIEDEQTDYQSRLHMLSMIAIEDFSDDTTNERFAAATDQLLLFASNESARLMYSGKIHRYESSSIWPKLTTRAVTQATGQPLTNYALRLSDYTQPYVTLLLATERIPKRFRLHTGLDAVLAATKESHDLLEQAWMTQLKISDPKELYPIPSVDGLKIHKATVLPGTNGILDIDNYAEKLDINPQNYFCYEWCSELRSEP
ncbi:MAG: protein kinase [Pirellulaceae bacterium]|nr:protein kinase [Pirellulaceae bacterium]